jgi:hypothetical protein
MNKKRQFYLFMVMFFLLAQITIIPAAGNNKNHSRTQSTLAIDTLSLKVMVPAYFSTASLWTRMEAQSSKMPGRLWAIVNPASGPGSSKSATYAADIDSMHAHKGGCIGYVYTDYGTIAIATVESQVDEWYSWYPTLDGIFFDCQNSVGGTNESYYQTLYNYVKTKGGVALVVGNPGAPTAPTFLYLNGTRVTDVICVFETSSGFQTWTPDPWTSSYSRDNWMVIPYNTSATQWVNNLSRAYHNNVGWIYLTSLGGGNPYNGLGTYFEDFCNYIINAPQPSPTLVSPADSVTSVSTTQTLTWNSYPGASHYVLQVSADNFVTTVLDQSSVTDTTFTLSSPLAGGTTYNWHVLATVGSDSTLFCVSRTFTTLAQASPTTQATNLNTTPVGNTWMTVNWTNGNGTNRIVLMNKTNSFANPADGTSPTATTTYSGSGQQCIYNGTGTTVKVTRLTLGTTYWFRVYEYNNSGLATKYNAATATNNPMSLATNNPTSFLEDFEVGTQTSYLARPGSNVFCTMGSWNFTNAEIGTSTNDRKTGLQSARIRNALPASITMNFDWPSGADIITLSYGSYSTDAASTWQLQKSTDSGTTWVNVGSVVTSSTTTLTAQTDTVNQSGNVRFKVAAVSGAGAINIDNISIVNYTGTLVLVELTSLTAVPKVLTLHQNYPNPFNPSTLISYQIPAAGKVTLKVYDVLGREVATLVNEVENPGNYKVRFDASKLTSGIYFYRINAGGSTQLKKMILMK